MTATGKCNVTRRLDPGCIQHSVHLHHQLCSSPHSSSDVGFAVSSLVSKYGHIQDKLYRLHTHGESSSVQASHTW